MMGSAESDSSGFSHERPQHRVTVSPFYLSVYEVTNEQYRRLQRNHDSGTNFNGAAQPAVQVSHEDAEGYAGWLSRGAGGPPYRLPTEAEWEHACRAGTSTRWSFGDDESRLGEHGWFDGNGGGVTHDVGQKRPNGWGLFDMHGNVWEWCADWFGPYGAQPQTDPTGPERGADLRLVNAEGGRVHGPARIARGASYLYDAGFARSAVRLPWHPTIRAVVMGVRLALPAAPA
jgi:formylglycine-generating enzyme required for sulfatase activity